MKLFYSKSACSLVVRIILNELAIPFEDEAVDLQKKKTTSDQDFLTINPKGAVPALLLNNGALLTENQVILQYLADITNGQTVLAPIGDLERYRTLEWLNFIATELHKSIGQLFHGSVPEDWKNTQIIPMILKRFEFINTHLTEEYLMGDQFTLPDAYLFVMLRWAHFFKMDLKPYKNINQFMTRMLARPSVVTSLKQEG